MLPLLALTTFIFSSPQQDLWAYANGEHISVELVELGGVDGDGNTLYLESNAAFAFLAMQEAAAADGVNLHLNYGFRSYSQQLSIWRQYHRHRPAALPGHSDHQAGIAIDVAGMQDCSTSLHWTRRGKPRTRTHCHPSALGVWMRRHADWYGWEPNVRGENWHFAFTGNRISPIALAERVAEVSNQDD